MSAESVRAYEDHAETAARVHRPIYAGPTFTSHDIGWPDPPAWLSQALCPQVDVPDTWFPEKGASADAAKRVCLHCPVKAECLNWALEHNEHYGIWGGLGERQRRALRRGGHQLGETA